MKAPALRQTGQLFMPARWQKTAVLRWLKRTHAWTGFWGAMLFLMLGVSGVLLNHQSILKIETGKPVEVSAMNIAVTTGTITDQKSLGAWAQHELGLKAEPRPPRKEGGAPDKDKSGKKRFMGRDHEVPETWVLTFSQPNGRVMVEYVPGSNSVAVRQEAQNVLGFIKNLHKGVGIGLAWVLFMDSIAGALIVMSLTGFLLWSRLHGSRLVAGGIVVVSVGAALAAVWPYLL